MRTPPFYAMPEPIRSLAVYSLIAEVDEEVDSDVAAMVADGAEFSYPVSARWAGCIGMEGEVTGDGRLIEANALRWDVTAENPSSFRNVIEDVGAHANAVTVGTLETVERRDGGVIWGEGSYDMGSEHGREAYRLCKLGLQTGVSMDLDDVSFELRVAKDLLGGEDEGMGILLADGDKGEREHETVMEIHSDDELMVTTDARIRTATQVAVPAFEGARISILSETWPEDVEEDPNENIVPSENSAEIVELSVDPIHEDEDEGFLAASAVPIDPPRAWFFRAEADQPTPLTILDTGEVFGHIATYDQCHIASPAGEGICVLAPKSRTGYAKFHTGSLRTSEGDIIDVGKITMGIGHAGPRLTPAEATAHYDNVKSAMVDVRAIDGVHGVWVSGALRPNVTKSQVRALRASPVSGDWRKVNGNLELHAALAVNVPGFPIPRVNGLVASGELSSLVAAGMLAPKKVLTRSDDGTHLSASDLSYLKRLASRERENHRLELKSRVDAVKNQLKVRAFVAARQNKGA